MRRISLLVSTLALAIFTATAVFNTPALAADATRAGDTVTYGGKTYNLAQPNQIPAGLITGTTGYIFSEPGGTEALFILTTGDPKTATTGQFVAYTKDQNGNLATAPRASPVAVSIADAPDSLQSATTKPASSCDGSVTGGLGWILCPTLNLIASGMDRLYDFLSGFLVVRPLQTDSSSAIFRMWAIVRDIANICFVIAFLVIVYSQITSLGISNYNLKRMLPRLVIAAILVNSSFWIASVGVDVSNVIGYSIHDLFKNMFQALNTTDQYKDAQALNWSSITGAILSGGTAAVGLGVFAHYVMGVSLQGALFLLIPVLVGVLIAVLVAVLVMAMRQALITCLVIISPLAFVAYLLPNTEKYFDKWKDTFLTMLLLFPIFSTIFGGAQLAGLAIIQNANSINLIILGMATMVAPVVVTPLLVKFSGSFIGKIAGIVNNPQKGLLDRTRNWAQGRAQEEKARVLAGRSRNTWAARRTINIDRNRRNREGWKKAHEAMAETNFAGTTRGQALEAASRHNTNEKLRVDNAFGRTAVGRQLEYQSRMYNADKQQVENEFNSSHLGHAADHAHRVAERNKKLVESQHEIGWNQTVRRDRDLLERDIETRIAGERATLEKERLENIYTDLKAGKAPSILTHGQVVQLQSRATETARDIVVESLRKQQSENVFHSNVNKALLENRVVIEGQQILEYAKGAAQTSDLVLAGVVAKDRKEWGEHAAAQGELMKHFKLNSSQYHKLATTGNATITVTDSNGNQHSFRANDEYAKEAAIDEIFKAGSYGQKMDVLKETGRQVKEVDSNGNVTYRQGYNFEHRASAKSAAVAANIQQLAPFVGDVAYDEIVQGHFSGIDSMYAHAIRQVAEGRVKADNFAGANNAALAIMYSLGKMRTDNPTQFNEYRNELFSIWDRMYADNPAVAQDKKNSFDADFESNYRYMLSETDTILTNSNLGRATTAAARKEMEAAMQTYHTTGRYAQYAPTPQPRRRNP
ncbi:MAG: hypothetical protein WAQ25_00510 [Candidatus Saccharimonas sp.]